MQLILYELLYKILVTNMIILKITVCTAHVTTKVSLKTVFDFFFWGQYILKNNILHFFQQLKHIMSILICF